MSDVTARPPGGGVGGGHSGWKHGNDAQAPRLATFHTRSASWQCPLCGYPPGALRLLVLPKKVTFHAIPPSRLTNKIHLHFYGFVLWLAHLTFLGNSGCPQIP